MLGSLQFNRIRHLLAPTATTVQQDLLHVLDAGIVYTDDGVLDYLWFDLEDNSSGPYFKAVCLNALTYLPRETRETMTVLEKMRKVLKGIYTAQVDFLHLVANVTDPPLGIVQIYGVQALAPSDKRDAAIAAARRGLGAMRAAMANFEQSRLDPISLQLGEWIRRAFAEMPMALTVIGQPDPRTEGARGMTDGSSQGGTGRTSSSEVGLQQNEYLFRGMAAEGHEFLNVVLVSRMGNGDQSDLYRLQERVAQELSLWVSKERFTRAISVGLGLPIMLSGSLGDGASSGYSMGHSSGTGESVGRSIARAHAEGKSWGKSWGSSHTESENWGTATSSGSSWGTTTSHSETIGEAGGTSHTTSQAVGSADGSFHSASENWGTASTHGSGSASGSSWGSATSLSHGASRSQGSSWSGGPSFIKKAITDSVTESFGLTQSSSAGGFSSSSSFSSSTSSHGHGVSDGVSHTVSQSSGVANGTQLSHQRSVTNAVSTMRGGFSSSTSSHGTGVADSTFSARSESHSESDSTSVGLSTARSQMNSIGTSRGQALSRFQGLGLGAGVAPSISFSKIYQGEDHVATMVADALRGQEAQLRTMALEGGVYVDNYFLCPNPDARAALETLIPLAFHGTEEVTTPVRPRRLSPAEEKYIRLHAMTYTPSTRLSRLPWVLEPWMDTTLLTLLQAATYVAPGAFEQGVATTVQERVPPFAFFPNMPGEVVLGHQYSYEIATREPTDVPVRLSQERMSNWAFCADTRMGKSVAAERLVFEIVTQWKYRAIVLDFGAGWRKLVNALPRNDVDLWGLSPSSPRPIRWNPLQIGRRILAEEQMAATVELLCNAGRMGERQQGFMLETLEKLYLEHGVLTHDPAVWQDDHWGWVQDDEYQVLADANITFESDRISLVDLDDDALQVLAVHRSKHVDMVMWYESLRKLMFTFRDGSPSRSSIEGVLLRLRYLTKGRTAQMYGRGDGSLAIEDLALPYGVCVLEGGARMSQYAKSALLSLISWHLYTDAVARREEGLSGVKHTPMLLLFEEGNKIITGVESGPSGDGPRVQSEIIPSMFRDAGKYNIFLGIVLQSPSESPPGILSSCNNIAIGQLKSGNDVATVMSALARSPVGFVDTNYTRFINRMQRGQFILKLGLAWDVAQAEPLLFKPLMVEAREPGRREIREMF